MKRLSGENFKKSASLLKEFIQQSTSSDDKKRIAGLALEQLQKVTAGSDVFLQAIHCYTIPRIDA